MKYTILQLLKETSNQIDKLDAELIIAHVVDKPREFVVAHPEMKIKRLKDQKIKRLIAKRKAGVPLAYLTGHKEFYGLNFLVNKHTLVPRPETELIVELATNKIDGFFPLVVGSQRGVVSNQNKNLILIDVGTGSGCIPIAIKKTMEQYSNGTITVLATDISKQALKIAYKNAKKHKVNIKFLHGNLLQPVIKKIAIGQFNNRTMIITANLPYLTNKQYKSEPSIQHEPKSALVANNNGLALYEQLFTQIKLLITYYLLPVTCYLEFDPSQSQTITKLTQKYLPQAKIQIKKDLAGLDRLIIINFDEKS